MGVFFGRLLDAERFSCRMRTRGVFLASALVLLLLTFCQALQGPAAPPLIARGGVLDLSGMPLSQGVFSLEGEWEFIYGRHVPPLDMDNSAWMEEVQIILVPSTWKGSTFQGDSLPGTGIATYRLRIALPKAQPLDLALLLPGWETAYKLFIDEKEVLTVGTLGKEKEDTIPAWHPRIVPFTAKGEEVELLIQMANFHHARGGPAMTPLLGTLPVLTNLREKGVGLRLFSFGSLLMIAFYHLAIFALRREDKSALYFSLFCLTMAIRSLVIEEQAVLLFFPSIPWSFHVRIVYLSLAFAIPFATLYVGSLFPKDTSRVLSSLLVSLGTATVIVMLFTPPLFFTSLVVFLQLVVVVMTFYFSIVLILASYRQRPQGLLFLGAFSIYSVFLINDILYHQRLVGTGYVVPIGFLIFVLLQAILLAMRYARSFEQIEELSFEKTRLEDTALTLEGLSYLDPLTGIANRRRLDQVLEREWAKAMQAKVELSFILLDIDFFKRYNDQFGHLAGDDVLQIVASTLAACARGTSDLVARYGGEEFALLLPGTDLGEAITLAEMIRKTILALGIDAADQSVSRVLSVSLGCSTALPSKGEDCRELVRRADVALYSAKTKGRNKTEPEL